jgi:hypothetical protein
MGISDTQHDQWQLVSPYIRGITLVSTVFRHGITYQRYEIIRRFVESQDHIRWDWLGKDIFILYRDLVQGVADRLVHELVRRDNKVVLLIEGCARLPIYWKFILLCAEFIDTLFWIPHRGACQCKPVIASIVDRRKVIGLRVL